MALNKSIEVGDTGLTLSYHKVISFLFESELSDKLQVQIGLYESLASSHAGKQPVFTSTLDIPYSSLSGTGDIVAQIYAALKTLPDYSGATDV